MTVAYIATWFRGISYLNCFSRKNISPLIIPSSWSNDAISRLVAVIATVVTFRYVRVHACTRHIDMTQDGSQCHTSKNKTQTSRRVHRPDHLRTRVNICEILSRLRTPYLTPINSLSANLRNSLSSSLFETMPTSLLYKAETSGYEKGDKKILSRTIPWEFLDNILFVMLFLNLIDPIYLEVI